MVGGLGMARADAHVVDESERVRRASMVGCLADWERCSRLSFTFVRSNGYDGGVTIARESRCVTSRM